MNEGFPDRAIKYCIFALEAIRDERIVDARININCAMNEIEQMKNSFEHRICIASERIPFHERGR